ncbi:preprotein translocase subunit YajC [Kocuria sp. WRN011]|uniref:preprotein translocase subunit YajC n=1 Tax=Kocuria sp. WRN011 TaxID=2029858 RepID=UPI0020B11DAD|nr:preprotein translocase subunit YajC [Kocuria sp. WRN011]
MILSAQLLAQAQQSGGGGTAWFLPVMLVVMVLLLWLPMRRQKKAQAQIKAKQATMEPGTRVMTSFGLYGTVLSIDRDENKAVLEVAPGTSVTVHTQTVTTILDEPTTENAAQNATIAQDGAVDGEGSTAAGGARESIGDREHDLPGDNVPGDTATGENLSGDDSSRGTWRDNRRDNDTN